MQSALQATTTFLGYHPDPPAFLLHPGGQGPKESLDCPSTVSPKASQRRGERLESGMEEAFQFFAASLLWGVGGGGWRCNKRRKKKKADMKIPEFQLVKKN